LIFRGQSNLWILFGTIDLVWIFYIMSNQTLKSAEISTYIKDRYPEIFTKYLTGSMYKNIELLDISVTNELAYFQEHNRDIYDSLKCLKKLWHMIIISIFLLFPIMVMV